MSANAEESIKQGDIGVALSSLQDQIRKEPANPKHRIFLFQLYSVMGDWDRALTQLNVVGDLDNAALAMVCMYREMLSCEAFREQVFQSIKEPVIFGDPQKWVALTIQALNQSVQGNIEEAKRLLSCAFETAPESPGEIDGESFEWIADSDSRLGPVLEAIIEGRYLWIPFKHISSIVIEPPEDLRDFVWLPAYFTWVNGGESYGVIPSRYPDSYKNEDPLVSLSRKTVWEEPGADFYTGLGQRMFVTNVGEYPLMDIRELKFNQERISEDLVNG